jgi:hypothetical protein
MQSIDFILKKKGKQCLYICLVIPSGCIWLDYTSCENFENYKIDSKRL